MQDDTKYKHLAKICLLIDREIKAQRSRGFAPVLHEMPPKRAAALNEKMNLRAIEIRRLEHEAHCLAVEIGIADVRPSETYKCHVADIGFGRKIEIVKRQPVI